MSSIPSPLPKHLLSRYTARGYRGPELAEKKATSHFCGLHWTRDKNLLQNRFFKIKLKVLKSKIIYL